MNVASLAPIKPWRWIWARSSVYCDPSGTPTRLLGMVVDITDRKQSEAAVKASNDRLKLLSEIANNLLVNEDPRTFLASLFKKVATHLDLEVYLNYLVEENQQHLQLHASGGLSADVAETAKTLALGQGVCGYVAQHRHPAVVENALQSDHPLAAPVQSIGIRAYASHPLMVGDRVLGTLGLGTRHRDRFTRDELDLMQVVANQVAAALERSRLVAALQSRAEALVQTNRIKDEFLAVLSHELRTPLNPILGWSRLLQQGRLDAAKTTTAIATIERNAKLQAQLVEDLLDISRIMQGKLALNPAPVHLSGVILGAIETVRLAAEAKAIEIKTHLESNVGQVFGDQGRLQQVVWNLLSNAVKFTPPNGRVEVWLRQSDLQAQLQIIDSGKGIKPEFLPHVFEHFRQEDGATTRKFGGLGLGLAIARQIVEMHGGRIWAESLGESHGAAFTVELPLLPVDPMPEMAGPISAQAALLPLAGLRVLVVDDDLDSREFVAFAIGQAGAEVTAVESAIAALQRLSTHSFDLLVSDIGLPDMDGYGLIREVRRLAADRGGQIPAIALTAYAGEADQQQAISSGFHTHLSKPVHPSEVIAIAARLCGRDVNAN